MMVHENGDLFVKGMSFDGKEVSMTLDEVYNTMFLAQQMYGEYCGINATPNFIRKLDVIMQEYGWYK